MLRGDPVAVSIWKRLQQQFVIIRRPTVNEILDDYLRDAKLRDVRDLLGARRATRRARGVLGEDVAAELDPRRIREYQQHLRETLKPATVNQALGFLRAALRHGAQSGLIGRMPEFPRRLPERNARRGFIEPADYVSILAELEEWARDPFRFAYQTGWRRNEVLSLRWDEVDLERETVRLSPERSKNGLSRIFPFIGEMADIFSRRLVFRSRDLLVVFHRDGRPIHRATFNKWFRIAADIAGRKTIPHDCRRTAYRNLLRRGVLEKTAREMVGWTTREMPDRYNVVDEKDFEAVRQIYRSGFAG